jgi:hypothetical protein
MGQASGSQAALNVRARKGESLLAFYLILG